MLTIYVNITSSQKSKHKEIKLKQCIYFGWERLYQEDQKPLKIKMCIVWWRPSVRSPVWSQSKTLSYSVYMRISCSQSHVSVRRRRLLWFISSGLLKLYVSGLRTAIVSRRFPYFPSLFQQIKPHKSQDFKVNLALMFFAYATWKLYASVCLCARVELCWSFSCLCVENI